MNRNSGSLLQTVSMSCRSPPRGLSIRLIHVPNVIDKVTKLYVGGLLEDVVKDDLVIELEKYGPVADMWIARNPPGFAFVEYEKISDAEKAVRALDGMDLCGSRVRVEFARGGKGKKSFGPRFRGSQSGSRGPPRRMASPRRGGRFSPPPFEGSRHNPYDQLASLYHPDVASAAAAVAGFPYGMPGYPPMLPFLSHEDLLRSLTQQQQQQQPRRRSPMGSRDQMSDYPRSRSPGFRRSYRSRSPIASGRSRGRSPPITYNGRDPVRREDFPGRASFGDGSRTRAPRNGFSPTQPTFNGRRMDSRSRGGGGGGPDDRRRR